jgi:hypothetical protein
MASRLHEICQEYQTLLNRLASETRREPLRRRMSHIAREVIAMPAQTPIGLWSKAIVALDWIEDRDGDIPTRLAVSLCRDVIGMFSEGGQESDSSSAPSG